MSSQVETYYNISEKEARLAELYNKLKEKAVFIVPSGLDKELLLQLVSGYGSFFGKRPAIWTWGEFYRELSGHTAAARRVIDPPDHNLIIRYVLEKYLDEMREEGVTLPAGALRSGFASILGDNIRDLLLEEVSPEHLASTIIEDADGDGRASPEAMLCRLYLDYVNYLDANGIADNAQIPSLISKLLLLEDHAASVKARTFIFVGFLSFAGGQLKLVKKLEELTECIFILPETGMPKDFQDAIRQVVKHDYKGRPCWSVNIAELEANNAGLQFHAIARELALWANSAGALCHLGELVDYGDVGIQVRPGSLDILKSSLARYKIPFNTQVRGNVGETLLGILPKAVWDAYILGWDTSGTAFLLSGPLLNCSDFDPHEISESSPEGLEAWENALEDHGAVLKIFKEINKLCRALKKGGTPPEILKLWRDFVVSLDVQNRIAAAIGERFEFDDVLKDLSSSLAELDKKIAVLDDIHKDLGEASKVYLSGHDAVSYIMDWGKTATLPISLPQNNSVTLYAGPPATLTMHRYWIMTDVDYNTWPGKLRESPLFRNDKKRELNENIVEGGHSPHVPELHEEREQKEALFRRLIATGGNGVIITRSLTDANGRPVGESQFVQAIFEEKDRDRKWVRLEEARIEYPLSRALPDAEDSWFPEAEVNLVTKKTEGRPLPRVGCSPAVAEDIPVIPLSSLDEWSRCPYRYWCGSRLRISRQSKEIFDSSKAGKFTHKLWELSWMEYLIKPRSFCVLTSVLWDEVLNKEYPELRIDHRLKRHEERLKKQVSSLAELHDKIESHPFVKTRLRVDLEKQLRKHVIDGVAFTGRADRIDYYTDGLIVLDYKSNSARAHAKELQLAAYSILLREDPDEGIEPFGYAWFGHGDASLYGYFDQEGMVEAYNPQKSTNSQKATAQRSQYIELAGEKMAEMASAVKRGRYPASYGSDSCRYCEFYTICRRRESANCEMEEASDEQIGGDPD